MTQNTWHVEVFLHQVSILYRPQWLHRIGFIGCVSLQAGHVRPIAFRKEATFGTAANCFKRSTAHYRAARSAGWQQLQSLTTWSGGPQSRADKEYNYQVGSCVYPAPAEWHIELDDEASGQPSHLEECSYWSVLSIFSWKISVNILIYTYGQLGVCLSCCDCFAHIHPLPADRLLSGLSKCLPNWRVNLTRVYRLCRLM